MNVETRKARGFRFLTGDANWLDYGGVWSRQVSESRFHFIRLDNMDEACGRDSEGHPRYSIDLSEVDLGEISGRHLRDALESCGADIGVPIPVCDMAEACRSYGLAAPLHSVSTNNAYKGIAECRRESYRLTRDQDAYEEAMGRPVNKIGSTAREFGRGDLQSALVRGIEAGNQDAVIMGKMYESAGGQTLGGKIDIQPITDALARR